MQDPEVVKDRIELLDRLGLEGKVCAEIGVRIGTYSSEILRRRPLKLFLVDSWLIETSWAGDPVARPMGESGYLTVKLLFHGNPTVQIIRKSSFDASLGFQDGELDFVYIDADHSFPFVYADLLLWYPKVKRGGWIAGHDFNHTNPAFQVKEAVRMFTLVSGEKLSFVTGEKCSGGCVANSFALEKTR